MTLSSTKIKNNFLKKSSNFQLQSVETALARPWTGKMARLGTVPVAKIYNLNSSLGIQVVEKENQLLRSCTGHHVLPTAHTLLPQNK